VQRAARSEDQQRDAPAPRSCSEAQGSSVTRGMPIAGWLGSSAGLGDLKRAR
jgi:hypothetical protein